MTSGGNNFSDFPENQLTRFRAASPSPLILISFGGTAFPHVPLDYTTVGNTSQGTGPELCQQNHFKVGTWQPSNGEVVRNAEKDVFCI